MGGFIFAKNLDNCYNKCYNGITPFREVSRMEFSDKIRYVRDRLDISQEDLARSLNVSFATVNRWENGKYKPIKMAQAAFNDFCAKHGISFDESEDHK
jgi:DNA-binding XRE family transcriptional regulator